jgi:hypothetical protein
MAGRYAVATIAGVTLGDEFDRRCRVDVLDGEAGKTQLTGSSVVALDFTVHTQLASRGAAGVAFGLRVAWMPVSLLNEVVSAMEEALSAEDDFEVTASDSGGAPYADNIAVRAVPDYRASSGKLYARGELSNDFVRDVVFRFISTGAAG